MEDLENQPSGNTDQGAEAQSVTEQPTADAPQTSAGQKSSGDQQAEPTTEAPVPQEQAPATTDTAVAQEQPQEQPGQPEETESQDIPVGTVEEVVETVSKVTINVVGLEVYSAGLRDKIEQVIANGSPLARISLLGIIEFAHRLSPDYAGGLGVPNIIGGQAHLNLGAILRNVTNNGCDDFENFFSTVIDLVQEASVNGAFSRNHLLTYTEHMGYEPVELSAYSDLLETLVVLSEAADRKVAIEAAKLRYLSEDGAARVIAFAA